MHPDTVPRAISRLSSYAHWGDGIQNIAEVNEISTNVIIKTTGKSGNKTEAAVWVGKSDVARVCLCEVSW